MKEITQKYPIINNLDLLYSKLSIDSLEALIQLDKEVKSYDEESFTITLENKKQKKIVEKILSLSSYNVVSTSNSLEISIDIY